MLVVIVVALLGGVIGAALFGDFDGFVLGLIVGALFAFVLIRFIYPHQDVAS